MIALDLEVGSWMLVAHLGGVTRHRFSPTNLECRLLDGDDAELDFAKARMTNDSGSASQLPFGDISLQGVASLAQAGSVSVFCGSSWPSSVIYFTTSPPWR